MAETNTSNVNDGRKQTDHAVHHVQPSRESKPPKIFAGTALSNIFCLYLMILFDFI